MKQNQRQHLSHLTASGISTWCPFGLAQAPLYFQQLMNQVLQGLDFTIAYLYDIVIFSNNKVENLQHLETVFKRLQDAGLKLKESKCDFFRSQIHYLGHMLLAEGIQLLHEKLNSITNMPAPEKPDWSQAITWTSRVLS